MGVLETVLNYKAQKEAQAQADLQAIPQAINTFIQAKNTKRLMDLEEIKVKGSLAKEGFRIGDNNELVRDESLMSETDRMLQQSKIADLLANQAQLAKETGNRDLFNKVRNTSNTVFGNKQSAVPSSNKPVESTQQETRPSGETTATGLENLPDEELYRLSTTVDEFTNKPTAEAAQAKDILNLRETDKKPLSGDVSTKYSGAVNGLSSISNIVNTINSYDGDVKDLIRQSNLYVEAANAKDKGLLMKGIYRASKLSRIKDEEARGLGNDFMTLSENILRARTGAAAPDPEIVREYARTLFQTFKENPKTWNKKITTEFEFLKNTKDEIRPLRKDEFSEVPVIKEDVSLTSKQVKNDVFPKEVNGSALGTLTAQLARKGALVEKTAADIALFPIGGFKGATQSLIDKGLLSPEEKTRMEAISNITPQSAIEHILSGGTQYGAFGALGTAVKGLSDSAKTALQRTGLIKQASQQAITKTEPIAKGVYEQAKQQVAKVRPPEVASNLINEARTSIKTNYIPNEYKIYEAGLDKIKGSDIVVKNADDIITKIDEIRAGTPGAISDKIYNSLVKLSKEGKLTESELVNKIKAIKGNYSPKVSSVKSAKLDAVHVLSEGFTGKTAEQYKLIGSRYSNFKSNLRTAEDLLGKLQGEELTPMDKQALAKKLLTVDLESGAKETFNMIGNISGNSSFANTASKMNGLNKTFTNLRVNFGGVNPGEAVKGAVTAIKGAPKTSTGILEESKKKLSETILEKTLKKGK